MTRTAVAHAGIAAGLVTAAAGAGLLALWLGLIVVGAGCVWFFLTVFDVDGDT